MPGHAFLVWIEAHPGLAGWAQALGGILAVLAALMVPLRIQAIQRRLSRDERRREARGLAILLYPELVHLEMRLARARNEDIVDGPLIETPVHVLTMTNRLHIMGRAGDLLLELLASLSVNQQLVSETQARVTESVAASPEDSRRHVRERLKRAAEICSVAIKATRDLIEKGK
jgi:hypothetical protein